MRSRTPSAGPADAGFEGRLSEPLTAVVMGARRRAVRDGDKHLDTAHLLHTLLESDPRVRAVFAGGTPQVIRVLGCLVQRTIGYGLRWSGTVEDSGVPPVAGRAEVAVAGWSPAASAAMVAAIRRAGAHGAFRADGPDLLAALLGDRQCRAVEVLRRAGVDVELLLRTLNGEACQQSTG
ncbi:Clp protease N-terminal domain-containing protein [Streptomyces sp. NPDC005271]|uniref:Clp protease N-terminal domain-containing protein n=1 Tax=Streptomyces sp. NPDC005271 TaxID=3157030 RepID=UPI0033AD4EA0